MQRHGYRDWDKIFAFCRPYILSHKKEFKVLFATIFLGTFISNLIPLIWGKLIDSLSNINIGKLLLFLLLYAVVTLLLFFMGVFESFLGAKLDYKIEGEIKQVMLAKALRMSCAELDAFDTGELMSRITSDAGSIIQFVIDALTSIVTIVINVITALVFSFEISPHLSAISLAFVPLSILSNIAFKNKFRELNERQKQYSDSLSSFLVNTLNHIFDIKAYRLEENETKQYDSEGNNNKTKIQNMIRTIMVGYLNTVDDSYTRTPHQTLGDYTVEILKKDSKNFYVVEDDLICVKAVEGTSIIEVKSYTKTADISTYEAYQLIKVNNYSSWPSDHPYLKNVREIEYGKFLVGYENEDGLNLVYNNIGSAIYEEIVNDIKEDGFIDVLEVYNEEGYGKFVATNGKSLQVTLEFSGFSKQLVITFKEIE